MKRFKSPGSAQRFLSIHAAVYGANCWESQRVRTSAGCCAQVRSTSGWLNIPPARLAREARPPSRLRSVPTRELYKAINPAFVKDTVTLIGNLQAK